MTVEQQVHDALAWLESKSAPADRLDLARFGITAKKAWGVSVANIQLLAKQLGPSHELAEALWQTEWNDARMLAAFVDEPARVTPEQMDRWCRDFDNWGICDALCFKLFDQTPHAFRKAVEWSASDEEFVKRAAYALLASLALHDKKSGDGTFVEMLPLIERGSTDSRNFVKKGVSWALRAIGHRNATLRTASVKVAEKLAKSKDAAARWIGKDTLRDLNRNEKKQQVNPVEDYLAKVPEPARSTLQKVRATIRSLVPEQATEAISYGMPAFKYKGPLVGYAAYKDHCSFFPMSGTLLDGFTKELARYETAKGTIRFPVDKPLPATLIKKLVKARLAENEARGKEK